MARRKEKPTATPTDLPDHLKTGRASIEHFFDPLELYPDGTKTPEQEETWRYYMATKRRNLARREFLATMTDRPRGVSILEWLSAHGYTTSEIDKARQAGLKV
jgi:hypothetical protein